jgi:membrane protease YdiL (CAAX protease family)
LLGVALLIALGLGHLRPAEVGLRRSQIGAGVAMTVAAWLLMQLAGLVAGLVSGTLALDPTWAQLGVLAVLGVLVGQLCGNALTEEVAWRGFTLTQAYGQLAKRAWWRGHAGWTLVGALFISQLVFALIHLPSRMVSGLSGVDLALGLLTPGLLGVVFALVYLRTGNLFIAVGLHALVNAPTPLFAGSSIPAMVMLSVVALVLLIWPQLAAARATMWVREAKEDLASANQTPSPTSSNGDTP